jgi:hypothetical protein
MAGTATAERQRMHALPARLVGSATGAWRGEVQQSETK